MKDNVLLVRHNLEPNQVVEKLREVELDLRDKKAKPIVKLHEFTINKDFKRDLGKPMIIKFV